MYHIVIWETAAGVSLQALVLEVSLLWERACSNQTHDHIDRRTVAKEHVHVPIDDTVLERYKKLFRDGCCNLEGNR